MRTTLGLGRLRFQKLNKTRSEGCSSTSGGRRAASLKMFSSSSSCKRVSEMPSACAASFSVYEDLRGRLPFFIRVSIRNGKPICSRSEMAATSGKLPSASPDETLSAQARVSGKVLRVSTVFAGYRFGNQHGGSRNSDGQRGARAGDR